MKTNHEKEIKTPEPVEQVVTGENSTGTIEKTALVKRKRGNPYGNPEIVKHGFKKGAEWKGNAGGRPKGRRDFNTLYMMTLRSLEEKYLNKGIVIPDFELEMMEKLLNDVRSGKLKATEIWMKYAFAQPKQSIELSGELNTKLDDEETARVAEMMKKLQS
jgi:hypothetical protein